MTDAVRIICDRQPDHRTRARRIATFERTDDGWHEPGVASTGVHLNLDRFTREDLDAQNRPMPAWNKPQPPESRGRYDLRCSLCGLAVPVRQENLDPILDKLTANRVAELRLEHLAAIVAGK